MAWPLEVWRDGQCVQLLRSVLPSTGQPLALLRLQPSGAQKSANLLSQALCEELAAHLAALQQALAGPAAARTAPPPIPACSREGQ